MDIITNGSTWESKAQMKNIVHYIASALGEEGRQKSLF